MEQPLRVLIIEDSKSDVALLIRQLKQGGYDPTWERVDSLKTMEKALSQGAWDIVISDHSMPHFSAIKALELIKQTNLDIPVIILSGAMEEEKAIAAMRAGASDYIMKGNAARLLPAIERELREAGNRQVQRRTEQQLQQTQKLESVGRLAAGVAHDFNNLLTAILGSCTFLLDSRKFNEEDILEIKAAAERAGLLTRQLLAFSRKQVLQVRILDLNSVISNVEKLLRRIIGEDITLVVNTEKKLGRVKADSGQIEQILMNLCVNARDAMPNGGKIEIQTANATLEERHSTKQFDVVQGSYILLSVTDTGSGMSAEVLSHLFEPFFTTKEVGKGTGLGLSTVYGIVKQSGGYILADSEPVRGTTFRVYLPKVHEDVEGEDPVLPALSASKHFRGAVTVLLVEDEERLRKLCKRILVQQGYAVLEAADGQEALTICQKHSGPLHIMVTDVVMPGLNGEALAEKITQLRPAIKVLYMSGYTESLVADKGVLKPGVNFLAKPFTPEVLIRTIREVLGGCITPTEDR